MTQPAADFEVDSASDSSLAGQRSRNILLQAALLGALADAIVRNGPIGIGWTWFVTGLVLTIALLALSLGERITRERAAWLGVALAVAVASAWRDAEMLRFLNFAACVGALSLAAMTFAGVPARSVMGSRVRDLMDAGRNSALDTLTGPPALMRSAETGALVARGGRASMPALRAALLTIPLLFVFGALLAGADPVFAELFSLPDEGFERLAEHLVIFGFYAWVSAGWLRSALASAKRPPFIERMPFTLGPVEISTSLGALNVLFAAFVGVQARWLFGGAAVVEATTGLTIAEYARRGFFELVMVAALVVPVVLVTRACISDDTTLKRHQVLSTMLLVLLAGIMASAFSRMALYVGHYGISVDRLYASVFMGWLAVVLLAMGLTVLRGWTKPFAAIAVITGFAALGVLNVASPEAIVARSNVARGPNTPRGIDYAYLARLSGDAMPIAARALASAQPSPEACTGARLLYRRATIRPNEPWNWGEVSGAAEAQRLVTPDVMRALCVHGPVVRRTT